jgi:hypothetical protein
MKNSWSNLLDDYNIFAVRVWIIVLILIAIANSDSITWQIRSSALLPQESRLIFTTARLS